MSKRCLVKNLFDHLLVVHSSHRVACCEANGKISCMFFFTSPFFNSIVNNVCWENMWKKSLARIELQVFTQHCCRAMSLYLHISATNGQWPTVYAQLGSLCQAQGNICETTSSIFERLQKSKETRSIEDHKT